MPPDPGRAAARAMLRRVAIEAPDRAGLDGEAIVAHASASDPPILTPLADALYLACYAGLPWPREASADGGAAAATALRDELAEANAGREAWQAGWRFAWWDVNGAAVARRGAALRAWWPGHWVRADGGFGPVADRTPLRMLHPATPARSPQPGFWFAAGGGGPDLEILGLRTYFGVGRATAPRLVAELTRRLHDLEVPFQLKVADREDLIGRRDAAILYTEARHFPALAVVAEEVARAVPLEPGHPPFTKPLLPGVAIAESPPDGASFGRDRCRRVAEGLCRAHARGYRDEEARLAAVAEAFAAAGLDLDRPWLGARESPDPYALVRPAAATVAGPAADPRTAAAGPADAALLDAGRPDRRAAVPRGDLGRRAVRMGRADRARAWRRHDHDGPPCVGTGALPGDGGARAVPRRSLLAHGRAALPGDRARRGGARRVAARGRRAARAHLAARRLDRDRARP
jgi:hypothetical protein